MADGNKDRSFWEGEVSGLLKSLHEKVDGFHDSLSEHKKEDKDAFKTIGKQFTKGESRMSQIETDLKVFMGKWCLVASIFVSLAAIFGPTILKAMQGGDHRHETVEKPE